MSYFTYRRRKPQTSNTLQSEIKAPRRKTRPTLWLDGLAIGTSAACLVHCLLLPIAIAVLPAASRALDLPEELHIFAFAAALPTSALAMRKGYRHHGLLIPAGMGLIGLILLGFGALAHLGALMESGFSLTGSILLMLAHVRNWQLRRRPAARPIDLTQ